MSDEDAGSWSGVLAIAAWQVAASLCYYATFAATSSVKATFDLSGFQVGVLVSVLTLGYTLCLFPAGALVDAFGDRPVMVGGLLGLGAGALGVAAGSSYLAVLAAAFVLGMAYATGMPATNRAVMARAPSGQYNLAVGVKQVGVTVGSAGAAVVVTAFASTQFTWRAGYTVVAVTALLVAVAVAVAYQGTGGSGELALPDIRGFASVTGIVPLAFTGFFLGATIFTTTGYTVPYLEDDLGVSVAIAGTVLALMQVTGSVGRIGFGALADRLPWSAAGASIRVLLVGCAVAALAYAAVPAFALTGATITYAVLGLALLGLTGLYHGSLISLVPVEESGAVSAAGQLTINLGGLVAPPAFGYVADTLGYAAAWRGLAASLVVAVAALAITARRVP